MTDAGLTRIYFSDFFEVAPETLEEFGAFDISLINDLPLFIDPFLLFNSKNPEYQALHNELIEYLKFLRDKSLAGSIPSGLLGNWFRFREVKQTWLGYSLKGNGGSGLGIEFARSLNTSLSGNERTFGDAAGPTRSSHIEKLCIVAEGIGRDNISDFTTNLIKRYIADFTQRFAQTHLRADQRRIVPVSKAVFNYETESWEVQRYELPFINGDFVLLTPIDLLTKDDVWINRTDLIRDYSRVAAAIPNEELRDQLNNYFSVTLENIVRRDTEKREARRSDKTGKARRRPTESGPSEKQEQEAARATIYKYSEFIDHYIRWKEDHGDQAEANADEKVRSSERLYIAQVRELAIKLLTETEFYGVTGNTLDEARARVAFLKDVIENKDGYRLFYADGQPIRREADLHIIFRLTWYNTPSDVNREVNNGRGPVDFAVSRGRLDKSLVEFKLAKNTQLQKNLENQVEIYKKASDAQHTLKVIVFFTKEEQLRVKAILEALGLEKDVDVILIDARDDNKPSASKASTVEFDN